MDVKKQSLHEVMAMNNSSFFIPPFQRSYAWGNQEIDRYFDDIVRIIQSEQDEKARDKQEHFFGVLVLKSETAGFGRRDIVVDGQQRLTTTLLMLIALRDAEKDEDIKSQIDKNFLTNQSSTYDEKIKLKQVTSDWDAYKALIIKKPQIPGKITNGYSIFSSKLKSNTYQTMEYVNALSRINVACIFLDKEPYKGEDPQVIFETLNSLGKPLSLADLVRNYVLLGMESNDQTDIFENTWHPRIDGELRDNNSHFFRDYLQYKESKCFKVVSNNNTKELYGIFTKFVERTFRKDKKSFVSDICRYVSWYRWIIEINANVTISSNQAINNELTELLQNIFHDIRADAFKPLVLGLLEYHQSGFNGIKLPDSQLVEALKVIRTYLIRRRVLKLTQGENIEIVKFCVDIRNNQSLVSDAKSELFKMLSGGIYRLRFPNDIEMKNELKRIDFYNGLSKYRKLILGKIEEHISKVSVDFRNPKITIEHIMPQSIEKNSSWKNEIGPDWERVHRDYLHNIGNLILTEFNSEMGNDSLKNKKEKLRNSNLSYRNDVINRETWNSSDIESHQSQMIERFTRTFPLPTNMQNSENWDPKKPSNDQEVFSPLHNNVKDIVTGRKPKTILINDVTYYTNDWQDVYLEFLRWLKDNSSDVFAKALNQQDGTSSRKHPLIVTGDSISSILESDPERKSKYKRLLDGISYSKLVGKANNEDIFVYTSQSANAVVDKIGEAMKLAGLSEEFVEIELFAQQHTDQV